MQGQWVVPESVAVMLTAEALKAEDTLIHVLCINAGLSCDGDSVSLTAVTDPAEHRAQSPTSSSMNRPGESGDLLV